MEVCVISGAEFSALVKMNFLGHLWIFLEIFTLMTQPEFSPIPSLSLTINLRQIEKPRQKSFDHIFEKILLFASRAENSTTEVKKTCETTLSHIGLHWSHSPKKVLLNVEKISENCLI